MIKTTLLAGIAATLLLVAPGQADAQAKRQPTLKQTVHYIKSKLSHMNVHYYSGSEAGLPRTGRRVHVVSINVSPNGRLEILTETSSAPNYIPSHRYKVVTCLSDIAKVRRSEAAANGTARTRRSQPFAFWLVCKKRPGQKRGRCVESHWLDEKSGKSVRMFAEHRIRVSKKDERQGPKLMRAFDHLRRLHAGKTCRRDRELF